jgi:Protein of unknown function (DUF2934)
MNPVAIDPHRIRDLAYTRWQARGCPQGSAEQDWLDAEQAILREHSSRAPATVAPSPRAVASTASAAKRSKPPRPTLKRSPNARAAKLLNEVSPKPPAETRAQKAVAAATAAPVKRTAVGSG